MSIPFYNDINLNGNKLLNVTVEDPVNDTDPVSKQYVDSLIGLINDKIIKINGEEIKEE